MAFDPTWLFYNSPRHRLPGVNQKTVSPLAVSAAPAIADVSTPTSSSSSSPTASAPPTTLITWGDGRGGGTAADAADAFPRSFFSENDYSAASLLASSRSADPPFLGAAEHGTSAGRVPLPVPRSPSRKSAEASAAAAGAAPPPLAPLHPPIGKNRIPTFDFDAVTSSPPSSSSSLPKSSSSDPHHLHALLRAVNEHGIAIVRGAGTEPGTVLRLSSRLGYAQPALQTIYGVSWEVKSEARPINIAYANVGLDLHVDLVYYESPPGLQLLHCREFSDDVVGGESTFVDGFYAAEVLRRRDPSAFSVLSRVPATFEKVHFDRQEPVLMRYQRPHIAVAPPSWRSLVGEGASSSNDDAVVTSVFWAPTFEGALRVHPDDVRPYFRAYAAFADVLADIEHDGRMFVQYRAAPGEIVVFNNRRMLHGRRGFEQREGGGGEGGGGGGGGGGRRLLEGCYVSIDEYKSRYAYLTKKLEGEEGLRRVKRVGNQDFAV